MRPGDEAVVLPLGGLEEEGGGGDVDGADLDQPRRQHQLVAPSHHQPHHDHRNRRPSVRGDRAWSPSTTGSLTCSTDKSTDPWGSRVIVITQLVIIFGLIVFSCASLALGKKDNIYLFLLSTCLGLIFPSPKLKSGRFINNSNK